MAIKYKLKRGVHVERMERATPYRRLGFPGPDSDKRRMLVLFFAFALFVFALLGFTRYQTGSEFFRQSLRRAPATIVEKLQESSPQGGAVYVLLLSITPEKGPPLDARAVIDEPLWQSLNKGDRITVVYQTNWRNTLVRVRETGRVALPAEFR